MKYYMAVTADKYELPVNVFESLKEMAKFYGMTAACLNSYIYRGVTRKQEHVMFVRVKEDEQ